MKKITLLVAFLMAFLSGSYAQCINEESNQYPSDPVVSQNLGFVQEIETCIFTTEHTRFSNILVGEDYVFSMTDTEEGTQRYVTVTDIEDNPIAFGESPLTVEAITVDEIKVYYSDNAECDDTDGCHTNTIQLLLTCPVPVEISVSEITTTSATFEWEPAAEETSWEVLVLGEDLPAPTSSTSGTTVSVTPTFTTATLEPANGYYFYVRANCGSEFSPWNRLKFASGCNPINLFNENFDTTDEGELPTCWSAIVGGEGISEYAYVETNEYNGTNDSQSVEIYKSDSGADATIMLVSPALGNLSLATHRLKFSSFAYDPATLEIGTLDGSTEGANFTIVGEELDIQTGNHEYVVDFTSYSGTDTFIGIRITSGYSVYLDDIRWEVAPLCPDVTEIAVTAATINSASFSWNPGGEETEWDIVYGAPSVTDPNSLTPITPAPTDLPEGTISGIEPGTNYKVWVRSVCGANDGAWIGPVAFTTPCLPTALFNENFDTTEYGDLPECWSSIIRGTQVTQYDRVYTYDSEANSDPNSLRIQRDYPSTEVILVSPNLSTLTAGTHRLKFYGFSYSDPASLEIGTLTSSANQAEFSALQAIDLTDVYAEYTVDFTVYEGTDTFVGIKLNEGYSAYLDDIRWEVAPLCPDVTGIEVTGLTTVSAAFGWTPGGEETGWDVVYGTASVTDPNTLTPIAPAPTGTSEASISGLAPGTGYNVWVRSKCGTPDGDGAWIGPKTFTTPCLPITVFNENFDTTDYGDLPTCWSMIKRGEDAPTWADIYTVDYNVNSEPHSVVIDTSNENGEDSDVILVSPNLSTLPLGSYRIKFYGFSYDPGTLEIGSVDSPANTANFSSWQEVNITDDYTEYVVDFTGYEGTDTFIGIRHKSGYSIFLDDIRWEVAPLCPDVQEIAVSGITTVAGTVTWTPGGSETNWQVVYGGSDVTDPETLTPSTVLTENTFPLSGLTQNTAYNVWVRSVCGAPNGNGAWMGPIKFNTQCLATDLPYSEDFESADEPNLPNCTSNVNVGDGNDWIVADYPADNFTSKALTYEYNSDNPADTWFFTRGINLTAGTEYTISYRYGNSGDWPEKLRVWYGNSTDADGMTEEIADHTNINDDANETNTQTFTPATTGVYYFGFNAYSDANQNLLMVDDIAVYDVLDKGDFTANTFKFYPNPVKDVLNLSYAQDISDVTVYNLLGQKVIENTINATSAVINMASLASGSYIVKVASENYTKTIKIIKE